MLTIDVPDLSLDRIELAPREVRGGERPLAPGTASLGGPFWTLLPKDLPDDDPEAAAFRSDPLWRWVVGVLALSLDVDDESDERYERAWVDITLSRKDAAEPQAVAWSMKPDRVSREVSRSTKVTLGPSLTIADLGIEAGVERGVVRSLEDVSIEALREKTATPRWLLRRTASAQLRGCTRLALVVRAPSDSLIEADVDVGFVSARRRWVFFWSKLRGEQPRRSSTLP